MDRFVDDVEALVAFIEERRGVTFVEIERILAESGVEVSGDYGIGHPDYPTILWWMGMSSDFVEIIRLLKADKRVVMDGTLPLVYIVDGRCPTMPVAKAARQYRNDRWFPAVFNPVKPGRGKHRAFG